MVTRIAAEIPIIRYAIMQARGSTFEMIGGSEYETYWLLPSLARELAMSYRLSGNELEEPTKNVATPMMLYSPSLSMSVGT
mmetsp:Transcript_20199/g.49550  ORF Transcript_20199/g.49550 Transcript_20199/m.49550 type:complete len:81 (-) Transcript_20199:686-928(-)